MKTITLVFVFAIGLNLSAQSKFESAIERGKIMMDTSTSVAGYLALSNYFERIASKETAEWLPLYYQALSITFASTETKDPETKEELLNKALEITQSAEKLSKNSETLALEGFIQMLRLSLDPAARGQTLSPTIYGLFHQAIAMDRENPRALLFLGQMDFGSAKFFGKSTEEACKYIQKAYDIFEQAADETTIMPSWGKGSAAASLQNCNQ